MPTATHSYAAPMSPFGMHTLREYLLAAGVGQYALEMSIPYMNFLPGTTEPYAQGVLQLVKGLQRLLNRHGAKLVEDGGVGVETVAAIQVFAGPRWKEKSWAQIYADVLRGEPWPGYRRIDREIPLMAGVRGYGGELSGFVGDVMASPLPWIGLGALIYVMAKKRRRS